MYRQQPSLTSFSRHRQRLVPPMEAGLSPFLQFSRLSMRLPTSFASEEEFSRAPIPKDTVGLWFSEPFPPCRPSLLRAIAKISLMRRHYLSGTEQSHWNARSHCHAQLQARTSLSCNAQASSGGYREWSPHGECRRLPSVHEATSPSEPLYRPHLVSSPRLRGLGWRARRIPTLHDG